MRIIRIISRLAKVPKVWRNLQKCDRLLREHGFKHVYQLQWENNLQDFTRSEIIQIHRWAGTPFKFLRNIPTVKKINWRGLFKDSTCLRKSILLEADLRSIGCQAKLVQGVKTDNQNSEQEASKMTMHAWVEVEGIVVGDSPTEAQSFTPVAFESDFN